MTAPLRLRAYQALTSRLVPQSRFSSLNAKLVGQNPLWFHAASVGELESLMPVIERFSQRPKIVTVFSGSGDFAIEKLRSEKLLYADRSPREGAWGSALRELKPLALITAKYEAWPDLWAECALQEIPLVVVGAKPRSSLRLGKHVVEWGFGLSIPEIVFLASNPKDMAGLKEIFPNSQNTLVPEPRWDRVFSRAGLGKNKIASLVSDHANSPRPWMVLGSVWPEDFDQMGEGLVGFKGTVFVVPHQLSDSFVTRVKERISKLPLPMVLVNQMGVLLELYSIADFAYVGGGFSKGIHNTIEPAVYGIAVSCGPKNVADFNETQFLIDHGILSVVEDSARFRVWRESAERDALVQRDKRIAYCESQRGGATLVAEQIERLIQKQRSQ